MGQLYATFGSDSNRITLSFDAIMRLRNSLEQLDFVLDAAIFSSNYCRWMQWEYKKLLCFELALAGDLRSLLTVWQNVQVCPCAFDGYYPLTKMSKYAMEEYPPL